LIRQLYTTPVGCQEYKNAWPIYENGINSAMSEFDIEPVLDFATDYKMNVIYLEERQNLKNRRQEILITNYYDKP